MRLLLDTHAFIWFVSGESQMSMTARNLVENSDNQVFVSVASLWEIAIKVALKKLHIEGGFNTVWNDIQNNGFQILNISFEHIRLQTSLPFFHRDPFDRMIVAQAAESRLSLLSLDSQFEPYCKYLSVDLIW